MALVGGLFGFLTGAVGVHLSEELLALLGFFEVNHSYRFVDEGFPHQGFSDGVIAGVEWFWVGWGVRWGWRSEEDKASFWFKRQAHR